MKITVFSIEKSPTVHVERLIEEYMKNSLRFAKVENVVIFNKEIAKATTPSEAQESYTKAYEPHLKGFCIALDVLGVKQKSEEFAKMIQSVSDVRFFIGGAYGFSNEFLKKCDKRISLSSLTYAHKIAKLVLFEQIYRALAINSNHPYHK